MISSHVLSGVAARILLCDLRAFESSSPSPFLSSPLSSSAPLLLLCNRFSFTLLLPRLSSAPSLSFPSSSTLEPLFDPFLLSLHPLLPLFYSNPSPNLLSFPLSPSCPHPSSFTPIPLPDISLPYCRLIAPIVALLRNTEHRS